MMIFSGSSNQPLAKSFAKLIDAPVAEIELSRFTNGESRVHISGTKVPPKAIILQSLSNPVNDHLVEFTLIADAANRMGAEELTAVVPYLGYSKQDKVFRSGEPLSVKVIAKMLEVVPLTRLITFDLHNQSILGFFDVPVTNLSARSIFIDYFKKLVTDKTIVVAPDEGAVKNSSSLAQALNVPVAYVDKKRDLVSGKISISGLSRDVNGMEILILDDMIVTGATLIEVTKFLKSKGAKSITVAATHHLYLPGVEEKLEEVIDNIIVTDTIRCESNSTKLKILSVAELLSVELAI